MGSAREQQALKAAQRREQQGQIDLAVSLYLEAGAPQEAARLRAHQGRHGEAAQALLGSLGSDLARASELDPARRKLAYMAAVYLSKDGQLHPAIELLLAIGERVRAADLLERSGDLVGAERLRAGGSLAEVAGRAPGEVDEDAAAAGVAAARRAELEGQPDLAVQLYAKHGAYREAARLLAQHGRMAAAGRAFAAAGAHYEAGICLMHAKELKSGLERLMQVQREDPYYRQAAVQVVRGSRELGKLDFATEHFLTELINTGPADKIEIEAFYVLSQLYEQLDMVENAKELLRKLLAAAGGSYRDSVERLEALMQRNRLPSSVYRKINAEDAAFRGDAHAASSLTAGGRMKLADLPGLPPLQDPSLAQSCGPHGAPAPQAAAAPLAGQDALPYGGTLAMPYGAGVAPPAAGGPPSILAHPGPAPAAAPAVGDPWAGAGRPIPVTMAAASPSPYPPPSQGSGRFDPAETTHRGYEPVAAAQVAFARGSIVAERYHLQDKLGEGGMALVFRALDSELDEEIAIKVFLQQTIDPRMQDESLGRFKQELKLSRQLSHPNIIRLYDIGMHRGHRYITMELLLGRTLDKLVERGTIGYAEGLSYLVQACAGLQAAHDQGVIHRDIKPENLFVTDDEVVKVLDFGIAKNTAVAGRTIAGMIAGTPEYMAPEQISDFSTVCPGTDLYSLGVVAFRMFTGRVPFEHHDLMKLLMMHLNNEPPAPRSLRPDLPEEIDQLILRLLAKRPEQRFASCRELSTHLQQLRRTFRR